MASSEQTPQDNVGREPARYAVVPNRQIDKDGPIIRTEISSEASNDVDALQTDTMTLQTEAMGEEPVRRHMQTTEIHLYTYPNRTSGLFPYSQLFPDILENSALYMPRAEF